MTMKLNLMTIIIIFIIIVIIMKQYCEHRSVVSCLNDELQEERK